jgi:hypothetical protein
MIRQHERDRCPDFHDHVKLATLGAVMSRPWWVPTATVLSAYP